MTRRELLTLVACGVSTSRGGMAQHAGMGSQPANRVPPVGAADVTLRIAETTIELGPRRFVKTLAYNGQVPGPLLRVQAGRPLTVDVWNDTRDEEFVHWHGLHIPSEVDGAREEGTPPVPPRGGHRRYVFTPQPTGTRWYHSHGMTGRDLKRTTYSGQFGMLVIGSDSDPGSYDLDVPFFCTSGNRASRVKVRTMSSIAISRLTPGCWAPGNPFACGRDSGCCSGCSTPAPR
jgi:FtsP/CotA-like multicopper oxidase with cupredoxin domain